MTISEVIAHLQEFQKQHGDIKVCIGDGENFYPASTASIWYSEQKNQVYCEPDFSENH